MCIQPTRLPGIQLIQFDNRVRLTSRLLVRKAKKGNQKAATQKPTLCALLVLLGQYHVPFIPLLLLSTANIPAGFRWESFPEMSGDGGQNGTVILVVDSYLRYSRSLTVKL